MICKDCELEVQKLNRKGICPSCAHRLANANWKGEIYIPIKDLKGTHGYNIAIAKRLKSGAKLAKKIKEEKEEKVLKEEVKENESYLEKEEPIQFIKDSTKNQCYELVLQDAKKEFKKNNLDLNFFKNIDLLSFTNIFLELYSNTNLYFDSKKASNTFNRLEKDYEHNIEFAKWDDPNLDVKYGMSKALLEIRRPNQVFLYNYENLKEMLEYLRNDPKFKVILNRLNKKIKEGEPNIYASRASEIVAKENFAVKQKQFRCEVVGCNLYGNRGHDTFTRIISAVNEQSALNQLNLLLATQLASFEYKQKDITITEIVN